MARKRRLVRGTAAALANLSQQFLDRMQFFDDSDGYGTLAGEFFRTNDGGRSWVKTTIPEIGFINRMVFLTPEKGWIAGINGKDLLVYRTVNGGRAWEESRMTPPQPPESVRDLFLLDQQRGWLTVWNRIGEGSYLYSTVDGGEHWTPDPDHSFQGKDKLVNVVRFTSRQRGFVFFHEGRHDRLASPPMAADTGTSRRCRDMSMTVRSSRAICCAAQPLDSAS